MQIVLVLLAQVLRPYHSVWNFHCHPLTLGKNWVLFVSFKKNLQSFTVTLDNPQTILSSVFIETNLYQRNSSWFFFPQQRGLIYCSFTVIWEYWILQNTKLYVCLCVFFQVTVWDRQYRVMVSKDCTEDWARCSMDLYPNLQLGMWQTLKNVIILNRSTR